jgi:hypothetical protein
MNNLTELNIFLTSVSGSHIIPIKFGDPGNYFCLDAKEYHFFISISANILSSLHPKSRPTDHRIAGNPGSPETSMIFLLPSHGYSSPKYAVHREMLNNGRVHD